MAEMSTPIPKPGWTWACSLSSAALLLALAAMALHIRVGLGHWPKPMIEDYQTTAFRIHEWAVIGTLLFTVFVAGPAWVVFLCIRKLRLSWRAHLAQVIVYGLGWLLICLAGRFDPTTFSEWFRD